MRFRKGHFRAFRRFKCIQKRSHAGQQRSSDYFLASGPLSLLRNRTTEGLEIYSCPVRHPKRCSSEVCNRDVGFVKRDGCEVATSSLREKGEFELPAITSSHRCSPKFSSVQDMVLYRLHPSTEYLLLTLELQEMADTSMLLVTLTLYLAKMATSTLHSILTESSKLWMLGLF